MAEIRSQENITFTDQNNQLLLNYLQKINNHDYSGYDESTNIGSSLLDIGITNNR